MLQGFHIITYALHIYYLNLFIAFLTPKVDPVTYDDADDDDDDVGSLPSNNKAEFKPFIRRLPEFKVRRCFSLTTEFHKIFSFGGGQLEQHHLHFSVLFLNYSMFRYSGQY